MEFSDTKFKKLSFPHCKRDLKLYPLWNAWAWHQSLVVFILFSMLFLSQGNTISLYCICCLICLFLPFKSYILILRWLLPQCVLARRKEAPTTRRLLGLFLTSQCARFDTVADGTTRNLSFFLLLCNWCAWIKSIFFPRFYIFKSILQNYFWPGNISQ